MWITRCLVWTILIPTPLRNLCRCNEKAEVSMILQIFKSEIFWILKKLISFSKKQGIMTLNCYFAPSYSSYSTFFIKLLSFASKSQIFHRFPQSFLKIQQTKMAHNIKPLQGKRRIISQFSRANNKFYF